MSDRFGLKDLGSNVRTEVLAGVTTFLTMSYIVVVNPEILAVTGMDKGALLTVTCLAAALGTAMMGLFTNYPFALAPGMGLNAFFAFTVCGQMGVPWRVALGVVFLEGLLFIALTLGNVREELVRAMPRSLKYAVTVGIGLFITLIGLENARLVVASPATLVQLGNMRAPEPLLAGLGVLVTAVLLMMELPGALLVGMVVTAVAGWTFTGAPAPAGIFSVPPSPMPILGQLDLGAVASMELSRLIPIVFAFFFVDFFDTLGTLVGVASKAGLLDAEGHLPRAKGAFLADALGTTLGAWMGTSTVTTYIESASGVRAGGRSGLTALVAAGCFLLAPFLAPLLLAIPKFATAPALILVGLHMMETVGEIDFRDLQEGLPAFLCIVMMPFTYSIAEGIVYGLMTWTFLRVARGRAGEVPALLYALTVLFVLRIVYAPH